jgi:hypothetical protein
MKKRSNQASQGFPYAALFKCRCGQPGKPRIDEGLSAGVHCDACWEKLKQDCRSRSW